MLFGDRIVACAIRRQNCCLCYSKTELLHLHTHAFFAKEAQKTVRLVSTLYILTNTYGSRRRLSQERSSRLHSVFTEFPFKLSVFKSVENICFSIRGKPIATLPSPRETLSRLFDFIVRVDLSVVAESGKAGRRNTFFCCDVRKRETPSHCWRSAFLVQWTEVQRRGSKERFKGSC